MLKKEQKMKVVESLKNKILNQKIILFTDFTGVPVVKIHQLRTILRSQDAEYKVVKKTLFRRATEEVGSPVNVDDLKGELSVTFGFSDEIAPVREIVKFSKENETFKVLGGILEKKLISEKEIIKISKLLSREVILGQLVASIAGPISNLLYALNGNIRNLVIVINKIKGLKTA